MNRTLLLTAFVLLAILSASPSDAQVAPNTDCMAAKTWHLQQALKISLRPQQDYHLGAADAAGQLSSLAGEPCAGWKIWASGNVGWSQP